MSYLHASWLHKDYLYIKKVIKKCLTFNQTTTVHLSTVVYFGWEPCSLSLSNTSHKDTHGTHKPSFIFNCVLDGAKRQLGGIVT